MTDIKPTSWRDVLPIHPAALLLPPQSHAKLTEIGEDIRAHGMTTPIVIFRELKIPLHLGSGFKYSLLDGVSRFDGMELVGVPFKLAHTKRDGWTLEIDGDFDLSVPDPIVVSDVDPFDFVLSANLHRRHLDAKQRRDVIAEVLKARPEKSNRQIAETVKASHVTVGAVRAELEGRGQIDHVDTHTDTKGRRQQARKPPTKDLRRRAARERAWAALDEIERR